MDFYRHHIFCCTNRRADGHARGSCAARGGEELRSYMKGKAKQLGLPATRVNTAGCLDQCENGPVIVVYPEGIWYRASNEADIDAILAATRDGTVAEHLQLKAPVKPGK